MLMNSIAVAVGGAIGSLARFWLAELFVALGMSAFPWATLLANVSGSMLIGVIAALPPDGAWRPSCACSGWWAFAAATRPSPPSACRR